MKKVMIYAAILLLVTAITVGGTYAFFTVTATTNNPLAGGTYQLEVIYTGDTAISGNFDLVKTKEEGYRRVVSIGLSNNSVGAAANIYIHIDQISSSLATDALNWEVYQIVDGTEEYVNSGTFVDCGEIGATKSKCTSNDRIYMLSGYDLSTTSTSFAIYLWLNGYKAGNEVVGTSLEGYIGAETENVTAILG